MAKSVQKVESTDEKASGSVVNVGITTAAASQTQFRLMMSMGSGASLPTSARRQYPDTFYVAVPRVVKAASLTVGTVSAFSLITTVLTGFNLIDPRFAVLFVFFAAGFYFMGEILDRKKK